MKSSEQHGSFLDQHNLFHLKLLKAQYALIPPLIFEMTFMKYSPKATIFSSLISFGIAIQSSRGEITLLVFH